MLCIRNTLWNLDQLNRHTLMYLVNTEGLNNNSPSALYLTSYIRTDNIFREL